MIELKKSVFLLLGVLSACSSMHDKTNSSMQDKAANCSKEETCLNDPNCLCWCSVKCGYRKKTDEDHPTYKKNDSNKKFCYCKEWDYEHYEDNCILHKNMSEPKGAM